MAYILATSKGRAIAAGSVVFCGFFALFLLLTCLPIGTDIPVHTDFIRSSVSGETPPPPHFLYHLTVWVISFFSRDTTLLGVAAVAVLAVAVTVKFSLVNIFLHDEMVSRGEEVTIGCEYLVYLFSAGLLVSFSLPGPVHYYLGQIPPNTWHSPTLIFLMPFALATFILACRQLTRPTESHVAWLTVFCTLSILAKPSFFFVFAPVYIVLTVLVLRAPYRCLKSLLPVLVGVGAVGLQYWYVYESGVFSLGSPAVGARPNSVQVVPFGVWSLYTSNVPLSLLASLLFPITVIILWPTVLRNLSVVFAVSMFVLSVVIFSTVAESGDRFADANFMWQAIVANQVLFLVLVPTLIRANLEKVHSWKALVANLVFAMHVFAGMGYLARMIRTYEYY